MVVESDGLEEVTVAKEKLDFVVQNPAVDSGQEPRNHRKEGVVISQVVQKSRGLRPGMAILEVNGQSVRNTNEFLEALEELAESKDTLLLVRDGLHPRYINLHII